MELLANGWTIGAIIENYPQLNEEDIHAALKYASDILREEIVYPLTLIKLLADENIPKKTIELLRQRSIDIISASEASRSLSDRAVIELANTENRVLAPCTPR